MTRRERMIRIISSRGPMSSVGSYYESAMLSELGLSAYTDEAIEYLARLHVDGMKRQCRITRENRARGVI